MIPRPFAEVASVGTAVPAARPHQPRPHPDARHLRRVDRRAHRHPRAADRRAGADASPMLSREASEHGAGSAPASTAAELDSIVLATASPDRLLPSTACDLQALLGADNAAAFDIGAACPGFVYALDRGRGADRLGAEPDGARGRRREALHHHRLPGPLAPRSCSATAPVPRWCGASSRPGRGILSTFLKSDGRLAPLLYRPGRGRRGSDQREGGLRAVALHEDGRPRGVQGGRAAPWRRPATRRSRRAGVTAERDRPARFRTRPTSGSSRRRPSTPGIPMSKVMVNLDRFGNTSSASIPLALDQAIAEGRVGARLARAAGRLRRRASPGGAPSSGGDGADVPRPGRAEGRDGEGPRRALSRRPRYLRAPSTRRSGFRSPASCGRAPRTSSPSPTTPSPRSSRTPPPCSRSSASRLGDDRPRPRATAWASTARTSPRGTLTRDRRGAAGPPARRADARGRTGPRPGAMAAVLGLDDRRRSRPPATRRRTHDGVAVAANLNAPDQTVISGDPAAVAARRRGLQGARRQAGRCRSR